MNERKKPNNYNTETKVKNKIHVSIKKYILKSFSDYSNIIRLLDCLMIVFHIAFFSLYVLKLYCVFFNVPFLVSFFSFV